jgi:hypothetical protein
MAINSSQKDKENNKNARSLSGTQVILFPPPFSRAATAITGM